MDCKRMLEEMNLYLDGALEQELCTQLETHLKGCEQCRVVFDTTKKTITLYRDQAEMEIPDEIRLRLHQVLRENWEKSS
jgi:predicted anti-sigma-YlaC factor YlaD